MASSDIWRMCSASEATTAVGMDATGEIDDPVSGFGQDAGSENTDVTIFAIEIKVAGTVIAEKLRIVLPAFEGKIDGRRQMFFLVVFRSTQVDEKTARVGGDGMQLVDS